MVQPRLRGRTWLGCGRGVLEQDRMSLISSSETPSSWDERAPLACSDDPPKLRDIFEAHASHVGNSLRRLGVRDADVPDLVQEVFVVVHRILPDYDTSRPIWPWIFGVVYRTA